MLFFVIVLLWAFCSGHLLPSIIYPWYPIIWKICVCLLVLPNGCFPTIALHTAISISPAPHPSLFTSHLSFPPISHYYHYQTTVIIHCTPSIISNSPSILDWAWGHGFQNLISHGWAANHWDFSCFWGLLYGILDDHGSVIFSFLYFFRVWSEDLRRASVFELLKNFKKIEEILLLCDDALRSTHPLFLIYFE